MQTLFFFIQIHSFFYYYYYYYISKLIQNQQLAIQRLNMKSRKTKCKSLQQKNKVLNNTTLLNFVKINPSAGNSAFNHFNQAAHHGSPKFIKIPFSSGPVPNILPENPVLLYPLNPQYRDYQFKITVECVKYNTLVCLPTGLGKTHIASILLMNFMKWFPQHKIFFLAPTRPLVRQQRLSLKWFYQKIGQQNVFEMNGQLCPSKREEFYKNKKIFFSTPQTFQNDLKQKRLSPECIKLIIFDQAHRAVGKSSYSQCIKYLNQFSNLSYRIIGLSATPGNEQQKITEVLNSLNISKMLYKDEEQTDVKKYFFHKQIIPVIIEPPTIIKEVSDIIDQIAWPYVTFLIRIKMIDPWVVRNKKIHSGSFFIAYRNFMDRQNILDQNNKQFAYSSLKVLKFLTDSKTDLINHGYETFKGKFFRQIQTMILQEMEIEKQQQSKFSKKSNNSSKSTAQLSLPKKFRQKLIVSPEYIRIKQLFSPKSTAQSHPKLQKLRSILSQFLRSSYQRHSQDSNLYPLSKVIIFTHFRSTAYQIKTYLSNPADALIRCELFHGQSKTHVFNDTYDHNGDYESSKQESLHLNQKQQIQLIAKFKANQINTLIATSIGQEGLDIGEVDCIICYDGGNKSPIRSIQRAGRTGRKRDGLVYILLMKGNQQNDYKKGKDNINKMKKLLKKPRNNLYPWNSSLLQEDSQVKIQFYQNKILQYNSKQDYQNQQTNKFEQKNKTKKPQKQKKQKLKIKIKQKPTKRQKKKKQTQQQSLTDIQSKQQQNNGFRFDENGQQQSKMTEYYDDDETYRRYSDKFINSYQQSINYHTNHYSIQQSNLQNNQQSINYNVSDHKSVQKSNFKKNFNFISNLFESDDYKKESQNQQVLIELISNQLSLHKKASFQKIDQKLQFLFGQYGQQENNSVYFQQDHIITQITQITQIKQITAQKIQQITQIVMQTTQIAQKAQKWEQGTNFNQILTTSDQVIRNHDALKKKQDNFKIIQDLFNQIQELGYEMNNNLFQVHKVKEQLNQSMNSSLFIHQLTQPKDQLG